MKEESTNKLVGLDEVLTRISTSNRVLRIEATAITPLIVMDPETGIILVQGRGTPEFPNEMFQPVMLVLEEHFNRKNTIEVHIQLTYYSSSFGKPLLGMLKKLEEFYRRNVSVTCTWYFETDDIGIEDDGMDYQRMVSFPFILAEL
jgi:hypothetical protein